MVENLFNFIVLSEAGYRDIISAFPYLKRHTSIALKE